MKNKTIVEQLKETIDLPVTKSISPSSLWLKGTLKEIEEGRAVINYQIRKEMTNPFGTVQGGILAAIIDDTMGMAFFSLSPENLFTTTNLNVNYLFGAKEGEIVRAEAQVVRIGKKIANIECKVYNEKGEVICNSTSNLVVTSIKTRAVQPIETMDSRMS